MLLVRAKAMQSVGADQFAVATVDEGVELRCSGIDNPILVLSEPPVTSIPDPSALILSAVRLRWLCLHGEASAAELTSWAATCHRYWNDSYWRQARRSNRYAVLLISLGLECW